MIHHALTLFADFHQFYIQDASAPGDLSDAWNPEAEARLLAVAPGTVGIGTVRNVDVPVVIDLYESEPTLDLSVFDHVVDCAIAVPSGSLVAAGCTDYFPDACRISLAPGTYRVRACYSGLSTLSGDRLDGDDVYRLALWPGSYIEPTVLKQRAA